MCLNSRGFQEDAKHLGGAFFHPWCAAKLSQASGISGASVLAVVVVVVVVVVVEEQ